jgi:hypothetical protein
MLKLGAERRIRPHYVVMWPPEYEARKDVQGTVQAVWCSTIANILRLELDETRQSAGSRAPPESTRPSPPATATPGPPHRCAFVSSAIDRLLCGRS